MLSLVDWLSSLSDHRLISILYIKVEISKWNGNTVLNICLRHLINIKVQKTYVSISNNNAITNGIHSILGLKCGIL